LSGFDRSRRKFAQGAFAEDPEAGYLKDKTSAWLPSHFNPASYKAKRRKYFASPKK
jgi:hypothetical protein